MPKDDERTLRRFQEAVGLDPDRRAPQSTNPVDHRWDPDALKELQAQGRLSVVDRLGQEVDIFSSSGGERLVNPSLTFSARAHRPDPQHGDALRQASLDGDHVMVEA